MSNPNPNLFKVWSPDGSEMIETSRANARDLTTHAGWLNSPPTIIEKIVIVEKAPTDEVVETKTETEAPAATEVVTETAPAQEEAPAADEDDDADAGNEDDSTGDETPAARKTEEDFADLTERDDVVAYMAAAFPDFKPHHLMKRDKLVQKAIELANG